MPSPAAEIPDGCILLMDRGQCSFVTMLRFAQSSGASAALFINDQCLCSDMECMTLEGAATCETAEPLIADDGTGSDIRIPSFLLFREDGRRIVEFLQNETWVEAIMSWPRETEGTVEVELWTSPVDPQAPSILTHDTKALMNAFQDAATFQPWMYIADGVAANCRSAKGENLCESLCTNHGRYCYDREAYGYDGAGIVRESLRRMCLWRVDPDQWWDYVEQFNDVCMTPSSFENSDCSESTMQDLGIDVNAITRCIHDTGGTDADRSNPLLDAAVSVRVSRGIAVLPTFSLSQQPQYGKVTTENIMQAVCEAWDDDYEPAVCIECAGCPFFSNCLQWGSCTETPPATPQDPLLANYDSGDLDQTDDTFGMGMGGNPPEGDDPFGIGGDDAFGMPGLPLGGDGADEMAMMMDTVMETASQCGIDVFGSMMAVNSLSMAGSSPETMDIDGIQSSLEKILGSSSNMCTRAEAITFQKSLDEFSSCFGHDLQEFIEVLPSALFGAALRCLPTLVSSLSDPTGDIPEECEQAYYGDHVLGNFVRGAMTNPGALCACADALAIPDCTLDVWPIPLVGSWMSTTFCLMGGACRFLADACASELAAIDAVLPSSECDGVSDSDSILLALSGSMRGAPMPDACVVQDDSDVVERYADWVAKCRPSTSVWNVPEPNEPAEVVENEAIELLAETSELMDKAAEELVEEEGTSSSPLVGIAIAVGSLVLVATVIGLRRRKASRRRDNLYRTVYQDAASELELA